MKYSQGSLEFSGLRFYPLIVLSCWATEEGIKKEMVCGLLRTAQQDIGGLS